MARLSLQGADPRQRINRDKLKPGAHVVKILDMRENQGHKGLAFIMDFEVVEGPSGAGFQAGYVVMPDNVFPVQGFSIAQLKAKELGKIQVCVAAAYGYDANNAGLVDDAVYEKSIARPKSPLAGRLIKINAIPHTNKKGEERVFYEIFPYNPEGATQAAPAKPAAPSLPEKPSEPVFPPPGWTQHPDDPSYYYNETGVLSEDELRALSALSGRQ